MRLCCLTLVWSISYFSSGKGHFFLKIKSIFLHRTAANLFLNGNSCPWRVQVSKSRFDTLKIWRCHFWWIFTPFANFLSCNLFWRQFFFADFFMSQKVGILPTVHCRRRSFSKLYGIWSQKYIRLFLKKTSDVAFSRVMLEWSLWWCGFSLMTKLDDDFLTSMPRIFLKNDASSATVNNLCWFILRSWHTKVFR